MYFIGLILQYYCESARKVIGFDTFNGFCESQIPTKYDVFCDYQVNIHAADAAGFTGNDFFKGTSLDLVRENLSVFPNMQFIKGDIQETINKIGPEPIALAFFDMDDYTPTACALRPVYKYLSKGGVMIQDHYTYDTLCTGACIGQRIAVKEFLREQYMFNLTGTNVFIK